MPMVDVRVVRVRVGQRLEPMRVRERLARRIVRAVRVLMVEVVHVRVGVF